MREDFQMLMQAMFNRKAKKKMDVSDVLDSMEDSKKQKIIDSDGLSPDEKDTKEASVEELKGPPMSKDESVSPEDSMKNEAREALASMKPFQNRRKGDDEDDVELDQEISDEMIDTNMASRLEKSGKKPRNLNERVQLKAFKAKKKSKKG